MGRLSQAAMLPARKIPGQLDITLRRMIARARYLRIMSRLVKAGTNPTVDSLLGHIGNCMVNLLNDVDFNAEDTTELVLTKAFSDEGPALQDEFRRSAKYQCQMKVKQS